DDGADHRADEAGRLTRRIETQHLATYRGDERADDADHDGDDDAARVGTRRDEAGQKAHDQADDQDCDETADCHMLLPFRPRTSPSPAHDPTPASSRGRRRRYGGSLWRHTGPDRARDWPALR